jgi:hypothetical protein
MEAARGTWTLAKIAGAIQNNLEAGLKTTANFNFSMEQLRDQVIAERNAIIKQLDLQGVLDKSELFQEINCIQTDCKDLALCCDKSSRQPTLHFTLPRFNHIDYIGLATQDSPFKIYDNIGFKYDKYRDKRLTNRTFVQLRVFNSVTHGFIFNPPTHDLKYISFRGILENPLEVNQYNCCAYSAENDRFPAPDFIVQQIIDGITAKWSQWYYRFQGIRFANTQNSIN